MPIQFTRDALERARGLGQEALRGAREFLPRTLPGRAATAGLAAVGTLFPQRVEGVVGQPRAEGAAGFQRAFDIAGLAGIPGAIISGLFRPGIAEAPVVSHQPTPFSPAALERARDRVVARTPAPERETTPAPSQPVTPAPIIPAPIAAERPPTPVERMPVAPTPIAPTPAARAPVLTPAAAPTPSPLPPAPALPGGGVGIGPARAIPTPAALPPTPVMPGEIFQPRQPVGQPLGQFEAMLRALQGREGGRFVPMPLGVGAMPFGPAGAQAEALRRLREREMRGIIGGIPANI